MKLVSAVVATVCKKLEVERTQQHGLWREAVQSHQAQLLPQRHATATTQVSQCSSHSTALSPPCPPACHTTDQKHTTTSTTVDRDVAFSCSLSHNATPELGPFTLPVGDGTGFVQQQVCTSVFPARFRGFEDFKAVLKNYSQGFSEMVCTPGSDHRCRESSCTW